MSLQENSLMFPQTINFIVKKVTTPSVRQGSAMGTHKTKAIQADLGIFTHILVYSDRYTL